MQAVDYIWVIACAFLVFFMQAGFMCVEAGMTRSKNNISVAIKNLTDLCLSVLLFWLVGYGLMFGASASGLIGTSEFALATRGAPSDTAILFFQAMFCGTAATILSGAVAERGSFHGYILMTIVTVVLVYPVFGHWAWATNPDGSKAGWLGAFGYVDFAGSTVVHAVGGAVALAAIMVIGPREGRFLASGDARRFNGSNLPLAMLGILFLWLGWFGFNGGSALAWGDEVPGILFNTLAAGATGALTGLLISFLREGKPAVFYGMNGALGGLVAVTAGCHIYGAGAAFLVGSIGGAVVFFGDKFLERLRIDDVVGAVPVHLFCGILGVLAVPFLAKTSGFGAETGFLTALSIQVVGAATVLIYAFGLSYLAFRLLNPLVGLRVNAHTEEIGLNVGEHGASTDLNELFDVMQRQMRDRDFSMRVPQSPFTEIGQIGLFYNSVMFELERSFKRMEEKESELTTAVSSRNQLLEQVLPKTVVARMQGGEDKIVDQFADATVVFIDIVDFTQFSMTASADDSMQLLDELFGAFDEVAAEYEVEKIKTIGDCYMFVAGIHTTQADQCERAVDAAMDMLFRTRQVATKIGRKIDVRIGVHCGPLVAGVVGESRFVYDLWGATVNIASRLQEVGKPGKVTVSQAVIDRVGKEFAWQKQGRARLRGVGASMLYSIEGRRLTAKREPAE